MPSFTTVLQDTSPMLIYSDGWRAGTSGDSSEDKYSESSFSVTQVKGATMSFSFYGTSVAVIGAKRGNHGPYHGTIDGAASGTFTGIANPDQFNQSLFSTDTNSNLEQHNLVISNDDNTFFDIDYIMFQSSVGKDDESIIVNTFQDSHPAFSYSPSSSWGTPSNVATFSGGSGHAASDPGAVVNFSFQVRDTIVIYGPVGPSSTQSYSVTIDSAVSLVLSANKQFYHSQQILFFAGNLGAGQHSLVIQLDSPSTGEFAIDYVNVYTSPSLGGTYFGSSGGSSNTPTGVLTNMQSTASGQATATCSGQARPLSPGIIAGLATTSIFAVLSGLFSVFIVWHYRRTINSHIRPQPQPQFQDVPAVASPNMHSRDDSVLTARPYTKVPYLSEQSSRIGSVTVGSSSQSTVTHTTRASQQRRMSTYSMATQPPQYQ